MRIAAFSDLHLEWFRKDEALPQLQTDADVVVLAGDIASGPDGVEWAKNAFSQPVVIICGNHEHYKRNLRETVRACRAAAAGSHVHFLENDAVVIGGVRFLGCTLWTDLDLWGEDERQRCSVYMSNFITDFKVIGYGRRSKSAAKETEAGRDALDSFAVARVAGRAVCGEIRRRNGRGFAPFAVDQIGVGKVFDKRIGVAA